MSVLAPKLIHRADANPSFERLLDSEEAASILNPSEYAPEDGSQR